MSKFCWISLQGLINNNNNKIMDFNPKKNKHMQLYEASYEQWNFLALAKNIGLYLLH